MTSQEGGSGRGESARAIEIKLNNEEKFIPLFRGNIAKTEYEYESVSLTHWFTNLENYFNLNETPETDKRLIAYKYVDKKIGDASRLLAHLTDVALQDETWEDIKKRIKLIYPTAEERDYVEAVRKNIFQITSERKNIAYDVDTLRRNVSEMTKLYLNNSGPNPIKGDKKEPIGDTVEKVLTNLLTCKLFSSYLYKEVSKKQKNQTSLDEMCTALLSEGNSCPSDKNKWAEEAETHVTSVKYQNNQQRGKFKARNGQSMGQQGASNYNKGEKQNNYQQKTSIKETRKCYRCGKVGHLKKDCRVKIRNE